MYACMHACMYDMYVCMYDMYVCMICMCVYVCTPSEKRPAACRGRGCEEGLTYGRRKLLLLVVVVVVVVVVVAVVVVVVVVAAVVVVVVVVVATNQKHSDPNRNPFVRNNCCRHRMKSLACRW